jgi:hypothetical protein
MDFELVGPIRKIQPIALGRGVASVPDCEGTMERAGGEN